MTVINVLQLTDPHLFADGDARLNDVPTRDAFVEVLAACRETGIAFDQVILTGDLAQDEELETYRVLRGLMVDFGAPTQLIPGNHDSRAFMREVFPESVRLGADADPVIFSIGLGAWRLIGIDTQIPGQSAGFVDDNQLEWLRGELDAHTGDPTLVFMHHPPLAIHSVWLDRMGLRNQGAVLEILRAAPQVRAISAGHIHQELSVRDGAIDVLATPSTAYQYKGRANTVVLDPVPPGFRIFRFEGDTYDSSVIRLPTLRYPAARPE